MTKSKIHSLTEYGWWGSDNPPPKHLVTRKQLANMGKSPRCPVARVVTQKYTVLLYDPHNPDSVQPKRTLTQKQLLALEQARKQRAYQRWYRDEGRWLEQFAEDRNSAINWAKDILKSPESYLILDTETTELDGEIIELALIDLQGNYLINQRINPLGTISPQSQQIHGISKQDLVDCPSFPAIYDLLQTLTLGKTILIYNASFDINRLRADCWRWGLPALAFECDCVMGAYTEFVGQWSHYHRSYRWKPLPSGDHSALGDCLATLAVIKEMAEAPLNHYDAQEDWNARQKH